MKNNKILSLLLASVLCLALLASCGSAPAPAAPAEPTAAPAETQPAETPAPEAPAEAAEEQPAEAQEIEISFSIVYADGRIEEHSVVTTAEFLYDAIADQAVLEGYESQYGFFIEAVNGEKAIYEEDGTYWAIYVNGEYGMYGVDSQPIEDGGSYSLVHEGA